MQSELLPEYKDPDNPSLYRDLDKTELIPTINAMESNNKSGTVVEQMQSYYPHLTINQLSNPHPQFLQQIGKQKQHTDIQIQLQQQSDSGANTSATNNISLLHDIHYIEPINVNSATQDALPMQMLAVGKIQLVDISGASLSALCYYSPDVSGTIISPDAIARQHCKRFRGFRKICNCHTNTGYLIFDSVNGESDDVTFALTSTNNLWYHRDKVQLPSDSNNENEKKINKLSTAASYELWHQRLCHPGKDTMQHMHKCTTGIGPLRGNSFWKCPSCMIGKCTRSSHVPTKSPAKVPFKYSLKEELAKDEQIDDLIIKNSLPGQHFHFDFGFMRTKHFRQEDDDGRTQTSIDGKNAYLLIVDRKTRFMWIYVSSSKQPPIDFCRSILNKYKAATSHRTVRCDQGELATSIEFNKLLVELDFTLEITGSGNSKQNGIVERPHRTLANMVRCTLHAAGLGPEYWSYALIHATYIKNRLPHSSLQMTTPYQQFTGKIPDMSGIKIFGSRVVAHNTNKRTGKLDYNNVSKGIFLGFTGTQKNVYFIDDVTQKVKVGSFIDFDEAHMTVPTIKAPLAAQALQRVGYCVQEPKEIQETSDILVTTHLLHDKAKPPKQHQHNQLILCLDGDPTVIKPHQTRLIQTGISCSSNNNNYFQINPLPNQYQQGLLIHSGMIPSSKDKEIFIVATNTTDKEIVLTSDDELATISVHIPPVIKVDHKKFHVRHNMTTRSATKALQSTSVNNARAAKLEMDMDISLSIPYDIEMSACPYDFICHRKISMNSRDKLLGMRVKVCDKTNKLMLQTILPGHPAAKIPLWREQLKNAYITHINHIPVTTAAQLQKCLEDSRRVKLKEVHVTFATLDRQALHPQHGIPQLYHDQMATIAHHIFDIQHQQPIHKSIKKFMSETQQDKIPYIHQHIINKLKKKFNTFTLRELKKRDDWDEWNTSIFKQLNQYHDQATFDEPQKLPKGANLLSLCWVYLIKTGCGTKKARCVCNGSPRFRGTVTLAETYASALDQVGARLFWATAAIRNYIVIGSDASNAFAEAPPPKAPLYVRIDENYKRWYRSKFPDKPSLPDDYVLRVRKALQGHPESPRLWATLIDNLLKKLNLQPCTHEKNLYYTNNYNNTGKKILFLRQVDDFAIACEDKELADTVIQDINSKMSIEIKHLGVITRYNGVDIDQRREFIQLHAATYINKLITQHEWLLTDETPMHTLPLPMDPSNKYQHALETAEPLSVEDKQQLEKEVGFTYRQAVGEIIYAMVTCRPDVSFAIIKLSQYATKPAAIHYDALKLLYQYLAATKHEGIYYWRESPREDLPKGNVPVLALDNNYDEKGVQQRITPDKSILQSYVDSDHASDSSHRRSVSGFHCKLAGGVVLYKTKIQTVVAQSSTEAEFIAAAEAGKNILYLRTIMQEIGLEQCHASILYEDNQGALLMAQAGQPTRRTKHIDIKYFALQQWVEQDLLIFHRINTTDNSSDALTKATPRSLFYRHNQHIMGKIKPQYVQFVNQPTKSIQSAEYQINVLAQNIYKRATTV